MEILLIMLIGMFFLLLSNRKDKRPNDGLIGMEYQPKDNSWGICLNDGKEYYLAGLPYYNSSFQYYPESSYSKYPERVIIRNGPYKMFVDYGSPYFKKEEFEFVDVECKRGLIHRVLFYEKGIIRN